MCLKGCSGESIILYNWFISDWIDDLCLVRKIVALKGLTYMNSTLMLL